MTFGLDNLLTIFLISVSGLGIGLNLIGAGLYFRFLLTRQLVETDLTPPYPSVCIIKTCCGLDNQEDVLFDMFFLQDYPGQLQLIFTVPSASDPALGFIHTLHQRYPNVTLDCVVSQTRLAAYRKVDALFDAQPFVRSEVVIWSDSDTMVQSSYVREMVNALVNGKFDLVTSPQMDVGFDDCQTAFKIGNNADVASLLHLARLSGHDQKIAIGHSIGYWHRHIANQPGFWDHMRTFFADDQGIAVYFNRQHLSVGWAAISCPVVYHKKTLSETFIQKFRHGQCQKFGASPTLYLLGQFAYPVLPMTLLIGLSKNPSWAIALGLFICFRIGLTAVQEFKATGSVKDTSMWFFWIPIWDLIQPVIIWVVFLSSDIVYHGVSYRVRDQYLIKKGDTRS